MTPTLLEIHARASKAPPICVGVPGNVQELKSGEWRPLNSSQ